MNLPLWILCGFIGIVSMSAQPENMPPDPLPYKTIPEYPDNFTQATILARTIDGLGFRFYWATEDLRSEDYNYSVGNGSRDIRETMEHILGLADVINNTIIGEPNIRPRPKTKKSDYVRRRTTLKKLKAAADYLREHPDLKLEERSIIYKRGENISEVPHWHLLNGPLADALWHCGQVVLIRRAAGNPIPPGVNVFMGKKSE